MLQIVGIKIFDASGNTFGRKYGRVIIFTSTLLFLFVGQILNIVKRKEVGANVLDVVRAIPSILVVIQDMVKMFVLVLKRNEIEQVILEIGKLWHVDNENSQQNEEMNFWIRRLKFWNNGLFWLNSEL
ncbi:jg8467 [Pararge aegeria aegeria]|uniref:Jg8467 protein n=1 Tax=Pararge aegeria aegeria TaxID=348720 RepID=A0A8S4RVR2_9NEOP|nr:jg8467 [Pararge aegeria aegeria]